MKLILRTTLAAWLLCCAVVIVAVVLFGAGDNCDSTSSPVTAPGAGTQTAAQLVRYFEQNGFSPDAAAGVVGNMFQESGLDPSAPGGGLVQNIGAQYALQVSYDQQHGLDPSSEAGQLEFLVTFAKQQSWWAAFNSSESPQDATLWWQDNYKQRQGGGAPRTDQEGGGACNLQRRMDAAAQALQAAGGGTAVPVSFVTGAACAAVAAGPGGYVNPLAKATGIVWERTDQGVDASMSVGSTILALGDCTVKMIVEFYAGQPAIVCELLDGQLAGDWWYMAEQVTPSVTVGQIVKAGQQIATYAPTGTAIETAGGRRTATIRSATTATTKASPRSPAPTSVTCCNSSERTPARAPGCQVE